MHCECTSSRLDVLAMHDLCMLLHGLCFVDMLMIQLWLWLFFFHLLQYFLLSFIMPALTVVNVIHLVRWQVF